MRDKRTPWYVKAIVTLTVAYVISPIDLIPDFIPVIGLLDEVVIIAITYFIVMKLIPEEVKADAESAEDIFYENKAVKLLGIAIVLMLWLALAVISYLLYFKWTF